jgi:cytochrome P450
MSKPIAPFIAPDAYKARLRYQKVLIEYFSKSYDLDPEVPAYSRDRADHYRKHGFNSSDIGKMEITALHGAIANTVSIMFWLLAAVFSDKALSRTIATEALAISTEEVSPEGKRVFTIDASRLTSACPNLVATFNETLRLNNQQLGTRLITADTVVSDPVTHTRYVLKAGNVVQMPSGPMHNSTEIWGANASSFDHTRFLKTSAKSDIDPEIEKLRKKAFLPFGGGKHLCPGRMFAFTEILGTCALLSVGFDMEALDGKQFKAEQGSGWLKFAEAVSKPVGKAREQGVRLRRKVGMEDVQFKFFLGENMGETVDVVAQL